MQSNRKNLPLYLVICVSLVSFIYLNFIGTADQLEFSVSSISAYQAVESSALKEFKIISSVIQKVVEIITLK